RPSTVSQFLLRISPTVFPYTTLFRSLQRIETRRGGEPLDGRDGEVLRVGGERDARQNRFPSAASVPRARQHRAGAAVALVAALRSEEHTSELQSRVELVCRLLLETKK